MLKKIFIRLTSFTVLISFTANSVLYAAPATTPSSDFHEARLPSLAQDLEVPAEWGSIQNREIVPSALGTVVHIQDAHSSHEAQKNIQNILQYLKDQYKVDSIFLEGGIGEIDPELLLYFDEEFANKKLAERFAREALIGGTELFLIDEYYKSKGTTSLNKFREVVPFGSKGGGTFWLKAHGIESVKLYEKNLKEFQKVMGQREMSKKFLANLKSQILSQASLVFNKELKDFFREWSALEDRPEEALRHLNLLQAYAEKNLQINFLDPMTQVEWPQMSRAFRLQDLEKNDREKGRKGEWEREKETLLVSLRGSEATEAISDFKNLLTSISNPQIKIENPRLIAEKFYFEMSPKGFSFEKYPELSKALGRVILQKELQPEILFEEIHRLTEKILDALAKSPEEQKLLAEYQDSIKVRKLLMLELTRKEYQELKRRGDWVSGLGDRMAKLREPRSTNPEPPIVAAMSFYETAIAREQVMMDRMLSKMSAEGGSAAKYGGKTVVMITGGFHSEGLAEAVRKNNLSYVEITPRITNLNDKNNYEKIMMLGAAPSTSFMDHATIGDQNLGRLSVASLLRAEARRNATELGKELNLQIRSEARLRAHKDRSKSRLEPPARGEARSLEKIKAEGSPKAVKIGVHGRKASRVDKPSKAISFVRGIAYFSIAVAAVGIGSGAYFYSLYADFQNSSSQARIESSGRRYRFYDWIHKKMGADTDDWKNQEQNFQEALVLEKIKLFLMTKYQIREAAIHDIQLQIVGEANLKNGKIGSYHATVLLGVQNIPLEMDGNGVSEISVSITDDERIRSRREQINDLSPRPIENPVEEPAEKSFPQIDLEKLFRSEMRNQDEAAPPSLKETIQEFIENAKQKALMVQQSGRQTAGVAKLAEYAIRILNQLEKDLSGDFGKEIDELSAQGDLNAVLEQVIDKIHKESIILYQSLLASEKNNFISAERIEMTTRRFLRKELDKRLNDFLSAGEIPSFMMVHPGLASIMEITQMMESISNVAFEMQRAETEMRKISFERYLIRAGVFVGAVGVVTVALKIIYLAIARSESLGNFLVPFFFTMSGLTLFNAYNLRKIEKKYKERGQYYLNELTKAMGEMPGISHFKEQTSADGRSETRSMTRGRKIGVGFEPLEPRQMMAIADPFYADVNQNSLPDVWEVGHGFNLQDTGTDKKDADGDGLTNLEEYFADTNPQIVTPILTDAQLTNLYEHKAWLFFKNEVNLNGLAFDRAPIDGGAQAADLVSIAGVGFQLSSIVVGDERGWEDHQAAYERALQIVRYLDSLQTPDKEGISHKHGFFFHFLDQNGKGASEVSSVDQALLLAGLITAAQYYKGTEIEFLVQKIYNRSDWTFFQDPQDGFLYLAWYPDSFNHSGTEIEGGNWGNLDKWNRVSGTEGEILYVLAAGSKTHPITNPRDVWNRLSRPTAQYTNPETHQTFVTNNWVGGEYARHYGALYINNKGRVDDGGIDYIQEVTNGFLLSRSFAWGLNYLDPVKYDTYVHDIQKDAGVSGLSAVDGSRGYQILQPELSGDPFLIEINVDSGTVAPQSILGSYFAAPGEVSRDLRYFFENRNVLFAGEPIDGLYGFVNAYNPGKALFVSPQFPEGTRHIVRQVVGVDLGAALLGMENDRSGLIWKFFSRVPEAEEGLRKLGFTDPNRPFLENFDDGADPTPFGGFTGGFGLLNAPAAVQYVNIDDPFPEQDYGPQNFALKITAPVMGGGAFVGLNNQDLSSHDRVSFWIRGEKGGENIMMGMKDVSQREIERPLSDYLPGGVSPEWQEVRIPLKDFGNGGVRLTHLDNLSFVVLNAEGATFYVDDIAFLGDEFLPAQVQNLTSTLQNSVMTLHWDWNFSEPDLVGYKVFRKTSADSQFVDVTPSGNLIVNNTFIDSIAGISGAISYQVYAVDHSTFKNQSEPAEIKALDYPLPDVDRDGAVAPNDALAVINYINDLLKGIPHPHDPFLDVNGDGFIAPNDALLVINEINARLKERLDVSGDGEVAPNDALAVIDFLNDESKDPVVDYEVRFDTNRDGAISPDDILAVINYISAHTPKSSEAEGEYAAAVDEIMAGFSALKKRAEVRPSIAVALGQQKRFGAGLASPKLSKRENEGGRSEVRMNEQSVKGIAPSEIENASRSALSALPNPRSEARINVFRIARLSPSRNIQNLASFLNNKKFQELGINVLTEKGIDTSYGGIVSDKALYASIQPGGDIKGFKISLSQALRRDGIPRSYTVWFSQGDWQILSDDDRIEAQPVYDAMGPEDEAHVIPAIKNNYNIYPQTIKFNTPQGSVEEVFENALILLSFDTKRNQPVAIIEDDLWQKLQAHGDAFQEILNDGYLISESDAIRLKNEDQSNLPGVTIVEQAPKVRFKHTSEGFYALNIENEQKFYTSDVTQIESYLANLKNHTLNAILLSNGELKVQETTGAWQSVRLDKSHPIEIAEVIRRGLHPRSEARSTRPGALLRASVNGEVPSLSRGEARAGIERYVGMNEFLDRLVDSGIIHSRERAVVEYRLRYRRPAATDQEFRKETGSNNETAARILYNNAIRKIAPYLQSGINRVALQQEDYEKFFQRIKEYGTGNEFKSKNDNSSQGFRGFSRSFKGRAGSRKNIVRLFTGRSEVRVTEPRKRRLKDLHEGWLADRMDELKKESSIFYRVTSWIREWFQNLLEMVLSWFSKDNTELPPFVATRKTLENSNIFEFRAGESPEKRQKSVDRVIEGVSREQSSFSKWLDGFRGYWESLATWGWGASWFPGKVEQFHLGRSDSEHLNFSKEQKWMTADARKETSVAVSDERPHPLKEWWTQFWVRFTAPRPPKNSSKAPQGWKRTQNPAYQFQVAETETKWILKIRETSQERVFEILHAPKERFESIDIKSMHPSDPYLILSYDGKGLMSSGVLVLNIKEISSPLDLSEPGYLARLPETGPARNYLGVFEKAKWQNGKVILTTNKTTITKPEVIDLSTLIAPRAEVRSAKEAQGEVSSGLGGEVRTTTASSKKRFSEEENEQFRKYIRVFLGLESGDEAEANRVITTWLAKLFLSRGIYDVSGEAKSILYLKLIPKINKNPSYLDNIQYPATFIYKLVHNALLERLRGEASQQRRLLEFDSTISKFYWDDPLQTMIQKEERDLLARYLGYLSAETRAVMVDYLSGDTNEEIAKHLKIPLGTVKSRKNRAWLQLQTFAKDYRLHGTFFEPKSQNEKTNRFPKTRSEARQDDNRPLALVPSGGRSEVRSNIQKNMTADFFDKTKAWREAILAVAVLAGKILSDDLMPEAKAAMIPEFAAPAMPASSLQIQNILPRNLKDYVKVLPKTGSTNAPIHLVIPIDASTDPGELLALAGLLQHQEDTIHIILQGPEAFTKRENFEKHFRQNLAKLNISESEIQKIKVGSAKDERELSRQIDLAIGNRNFKGMRGVVSHQANQLLGKSHDIYRMLMPSEIKQVVAQALMGADYLRNAKEAVEGTVNLSAWMAQQGIQSDLLSARIQAAIAMLKQITASA